MTRAIEELRNLAAVVTERYEDLGPPYICPSCGEVTEEVELLDDPTRRNPTPDAHKTKCESCGHVATIDEFLGESHV